MRFFRRIASVAATLISLTSMAGPADIRVVGVGAVQNALRVLAAEFGNETGHRVILTIDAPAPWTGELVVASLGEIVHARSGDKGGDANLGVWVRDRQAWDWLKSTLTVDELRRLLPETRELAISRYELPNLGAVNFVVRGLLGTGATSALRQDAQAKALGEWLRSRRIKVPRSLVGQHS